MRRKPRRIIAGLLIVAGVLVMLLVPDSPIGIAVLGLAVVLELVGIALEHKRDG